MKYILIIIITFNLLLSTLGSESPNVIYILADDLGYGDLKSFNPDSKIKTPHLDRLTAGGMTFTDANSSSSVCTPSRYSILTGRYCWRTRLKESVLWGTSRHLIAPERLSVADLFKKKGYHTAMIGKWHLGWDFALKKGYSVKKDALHIPLEAIDYAGKIKNGPDSLGFDSYFGIAGSLDMEPYVYVRNGRVRLEEKIKSSFCCWNRDKVLFQSRLSD